MLFLKALVHDSSLNNAPVIFLDTFLKVSLSALLICIFIGATGWISDKVEERYGKGAGLTAFVLLVMVPFLTIIVTLFRLKSNW